MDKHLDILTKLLEWWWENGWHGILPADAKWHIYNRLKKDDK